MRTPSTRAIPTPIAPASPPVGPTWRVAHEVFEPHLLTPPDGASVRVIREPASGLEAIIAVHDTEPGPALGGIRRRHFGDWSDALHEAQWLAEAMSLKARLADLPCGGSKTVIVDHPSLDLPAAYRILGEVVESLGGAVFVGPDMGTSAAELAFVRERTSHVNAVENDASAATARGVLAAIDAAVAFRGLSLDGERAVVQGLGGVGYLVARGLVARGARLTVAEPQKAVIRRLEAEIGRAVEVVPSGQCAEVPCVLYAPCSVGDVITVRNRMKLGAKVICGAANLQTSGAAMDCFARFSDALWVPDVLVNAGAVIEGAMVALSKPTPSRAEIDLAIDAIGPRTRRFLEAHRGSTASTLEFMLSEARNKLGRRS